MTVQMSVPFGSLVGLSRSGRDRMSNRDKCKVDYNDDDRFVGHLSLTLNAPSSAVHL